jgi:serine/threonine-protein kinase RsbW
MSRSAEPIVLDLPSEASVLNLVRAALRAVAEDGRRVRLEPREVDEVQVALQEACTNAIRHAHHGDPTRRLRVEMRRMEDSLEILVKDSGEPFDLDAKKPAQPESLQESGYGIRIMRSWMDDVVLTRDEVGNVLRLVRRYRTKAGENGVPAR